MKVSQNTMLSDLRNLATSGTNNVDFRLEDSQMVYWCDQARATLIAQDIQKRKDLSTVWVQPLTCLELEQVDKSECCEVDSNCTILRTVLEIPRTIETNGTDCIVRVTDTDGNIIPRISINSAKFDSYSKYTSDKAKWYLKDDKIYIINNDTLSNINVDGIFESPSDLAAYITCSGNSCFELNDDYPCSYKMASDIVNMVLKTKVFPFLSMAQDTTNNDNSDQSQPPKQQ